MTDTTTTTTDLKTLASDMWRRLKTADTSEKKAVDLRIEAGRMLIEAWQRVKKGEAGKTTWKNWVEENVERSLRDVQRLIKLAKAPDPYAARNEENATARTGMAETRAKKKADGLATNVSRDEAIEQVRSLLDEHQLWGWVVQEATAKVRQEPETLPTEQTNAAAA